MDQGSILKFNMLFFLFLRFNRQVSDRISAGFFMQNSELIYSERDSFMTWSVKTGPLLLAQIHGYLLDLNSMKTLIVGLHKIKIFMQ
jgi:hypothetical protein